MTNNAKNEARAKERVENLRRLLAQSITRLDEANDLRGVFLRVYEGGVK